MQRKRQLVLCVLAVMVSGCALIRHSDELLVLKRVGDSQRETQKYVAKQERLFSVLCDDVNSGRLQPGMSKRTATA